MASHCAVESAAASARIEQLEAVEPIRREQRFVHELERDARLDERLVHPEDVIAGTIAGRDAG